MSLSLALGIVAVVNLAIGYALAVLLEKGNGPTVPPFVATQQPIDADRSSETYVTPQTSEAGNDQLTKHSEQLVEVETINATASLEPPEEPRKTSADSKSSEVDLNAVYDSATKSTRAIIAGPTNKEELNPPRDARNDEPDNKPSATTTDTIADCERLLNTTEQLLRDEQELSSEGACSLEPRATLADASQLETAITAWWQNDPERTRPICVGQIEIDNLRQLTGEFGASLANNLTRRIERCVLSMLRRDDLVASLGGSRFLVVLPDADGSTSAKLIDQLRRRLETIEYVLSEQIIRTTVTGGVAQATDDENVEAFLARAAVALSSARKAGRNCVAWHDGAAISTVEPISLSDHPERVVI